MGLGVSLGILPGTGPLAALCLALLLKVNRTSALLGSLLTNTWLSWLLLIPALKIGAYILGIEWQKVYQKILESMQNFRLINMFKLSLLEIIFPLLIGYALIALFLGIAAYLTAMFLLLKRKEIKSPRV